MSIFILLSLLGLAGGFTAIDPQAAEPVGSVPLVTGIWTGISMMVAAFVGGYVASSISGLSRRKDGLFHGLVVWGVNTLLFFYLITTSVGSLLGGAFNALGQGAQAVTGAVGEATDGSQGLIGQLETMITGAQGGDISQESLGTLNQQLSAGDRQGAMDTLVTEMGFTQDRAQTVVDQAMPLYSSAQQIPSGQEVASSTVSGLTQASWFIFAGVLLSMLLSIGGGYVGARTVAKRRTLLAH
ncbi:MAG: hypothetical protein WDA20_07130 [Desulfuromonadales bacterium]